VSQPPADPNDFEALYYRHIGKIYTPYVTCENMDFETSNLRALFRAAALQCPAVDEPAFGALFDCAKQRDFGLTLVS
jgi:hypothetical protein